MAPKQAQDKSQNPLPLRLSVPVQDFFTHNVIGEQTIERKTTTKSTNQKAQKPPENEGGSTSDQKPQAEPKNQPEGSARMMPWPPFSHQAIEAGLKHITPEGRAEILAKQASLADAKVALQGAGGNKCLIEAESNKNAGKGALGSKDGRIVVLSSDCDANIVIGQDEKERKKS